MENFCLNATEIHPVWEGSAYLESLSKISVIETECDKIL